MPSANLQVASSTFSNVPPVERPSQKAILTQRLTSIKINKDINALGDLALTKKQSISLPRYVHLSAKSACVRPWALRVLRTKSLILLGVYLISSFYYRNKYVPARELYANFSSKKANCACSGIFIESASHNGQCTHLILCYL